MGEKFVAFLNEVGKEDVSTAGGKGANLGEMYNIGLPVPEAFIVTTNAYFFFLRKLFLEGKIRVILKSLNVDNPVSLEQTSSQIRSLILSSKIPAEVSNQIIEAYERLGMFLKPALVAIRSSATAEDLPTASFAGQQETFLNVKGESAVLQNVRSCWASLWLPRAIFYRHEQNLDHFRIGIAVPIQKMIQAEESGVMFTIDPLTNNKNKILIEAIYGLGELIVQGQTIPDRYEIDKANLSITKKEISAQNSMLVKKGLENKLVNTPKNKKALQKITDRQILSLAQLAEKIEKHYFYPQDIEWAIEKDKIYIVQTRPVTTMSKIEETADETRIFPSTRKLKPVLTGIAASPGVVAGFVKIIKSAKEIDKINRGDILVTEMTNPDFVPAMKKAAAILTDKGGRTAHAAIVSRELGIPCVVGAQTATKTLKNGQVITLNGMTGEVFLGGKLSRNLFPTKAMKEQPPTFSGGKLPEKTATKLYLNLAEPEKAFEAAKMPVDGVGLLRAEFMIAQIGIHPKKLIREKKKSFFIDKLSEGMSVFCQSFNPRPVIYRTTDFKTNEYKDLKGGREFEQEEANPMLGYRGAFRYQADPEVLELELEAIKRVRNKLGEKNLWLMLPFVRSPQELVDVKKIIAASGLTRSSSFKIWLMVEIPINVILLDQFIDTGIDGISLGSNDLTMLILGVDRDNSEVAKLYNEQNPAVLWAIEKTIKTCQRRGITSSICGQAPSDFQSLVEKLVSWGITSISVNPDAVVRTKEIIAEAEKKLITKRVK